MRTNRNLLCCTLALAFSLNANAQDQGEDLAKQLANPVASLVSVPIQVNYDENYGADDAGSVWRTNIQPVIPFSISENWNIISRTILPVIDQEDVPSQGVDESGLGDTLQSVFFSPKQPTANGWIWGAGPAFLLPTASDELLGSEKWGIGPTGVVLKQQGPWTYGMLANHIESISGESDRADISASFLQPFLAYVTETKTTFTINSESTYDWENENWSVPVNFVVSQLFAVRGQALQLSVGARYWADTPENGPDDWGLRLVLTFLFPK